jgi:hypothetical protein
MLWLIGGVILLLIFGCFAGISTGGISFEDGSCTCHTGSNRCPECSQKIKAES